MNNSNPTMNKPASNIKTKPVGMPGRGGPGGMNFGSGEKAKNFKGTMKNLVKYLKPYWVSIIVVVIFAIVSTVFAIVSPKLLGNMTTHIVDDYISIVTYDQFKAKLPEGMNIPAGTTGADLLKMAPAEMLTKIPTDQLEKIKALDMSQRPVIDFGPIGQIGLLLIGLYLISALFSYLQGWIMTNVTQKVSYVFRKDISAKINRMPLKYFDSRTYGEVLSRVTNDVDTISSSLNQSMTQIITSITTILGILIMMFSISWQMTLVALVTLPISFGFIAFIVKRTQKYFKDQQNTLGSINGQVEEMYSGHNIVKVFNGEKRALQVFQKTNKELYTSAWKSQFFSGLMWPIMSFIGNLGYVGVCVVGGYLAVKGLINIGDIQAFIQYVSQFNQPIIQTANVANVLQSTAAAAERVFEFLAEKEEIAEVENTVQLTKVKGSVEFDHVVFGYNPDKTVIKDFTAIVTPGQRVAIVGPTGAGKNNNGKSFNEIL